MTRVLRPVSGLERAWLVGGRLYPPFAIHLVVEAPPPLDVDRWRDAITTTATRWPGLRARLTGWLRSARWIKDDRPFPVEVLDVRWGGDHPHALLDTELVPGPGARAIVLPDEGRVIFSAHHALTDGRGLFAFVADVVGVLAGRPPEGAAGGPLIDADLARAIAPTAVFSPPDKVHRSPFGDTPDDLPGITWRRRRLSAGRRVVARALRAVVEATGTELLLGVPVDLRRHRPELRSSANLTGVAHLAAGAHTPVDALAADLREALNAGAAGAHALAGEALRGVPLWLSTAVARRSTRHTDPRVSTSAVVSSLGRHDLRLDEQPLRVLFVPPGSEGLPLFMGLCGTAEGIELSAVVPRAWAGPDGAHLERWLDRFASAFEAGDPAR